MSSEISIEGPGRLKPAPTTGSGDAGRLKPAPTTGSGDAGRLKPAPTTGSDDAGRLKPAPTSDDAMSGAGELVGAGFSRPDKSFDRPADEGFRPWHFFVLASILLATVAVLLARQSSPEHLILLSLTIAAAGAAAGAFYRTLAPLAAPLAARSGEPVSERARAALEREKALVLRSIKELEFDRAMGKLSQKDFDEMSGRLRSRALSLMKQLDRGSAGYADAIEKELAGRLKSSAVTAHACASCGAGNDPDAVFCKKCGTRLQA